MAIWVIFKGGEETGGAREWEYRAGVRAEEEKSPRGRRRWRAFTEVVIARGGDAFCPLSVRRYGVHEQLRCAYICNTSIL